MTGEGKNATLHLLFEALGRPNYKNQGYYSAQIETSLASILLNLYAPYFNDDKHHPNIEFLKKASQEAYNIECTLINFEALDPSARDAFLQMKASTLFEMFNEGALRGCDGAARQALLDSFSFLPNRFLDANGYFLIPHNEDAFFIRQIANYRSEEINDFKSCKAAIDKFPSLFAVRSEKLLSDGNRVIPGAMIRDGVHVGKRNIFMFHSAVNIAAFIGDDNLIDSHASIGSAAQIGNRNKIASFVSLEGVLSPANARPVMIGDANFIGTFARIGTGITLKDNNFIASGVNLSLGTRLKDCRNESSHKGQYVAVKEIEDFSGLAIAPNNAVRNFNGVELLPGEYSLFENTEEFMSRFQGDDRIRAK
jgi:tetrahydrodipicolinate N-succinyltransferase